MRTAKRLSRLSDVSLCLVSIGGHDIVVGAEWQVASGWVRRFVGFGRKVPGFGTINVGVFHM